MQKKTWLIILAAVAFTVLFFLFRILVFNLLTGGVSVQEVSLQQAEEMYRQGAFILDVRQPDEWQDGHIAGSTLIPLEQLPDRLDEVPVDEDVVVVCETGNRSSQGARILMNAGYEQVFSLQGGVTAWKQGGFELETGD